MENITGYNSDSNGRRWWKFPDGTLICARSLELTATWESWVGGLYISTGLTLGTFPQKFASVPVLTYSVASDAIIMPGGRIGLTADAAGECSLVRGSNTTKSVTVNYIAIGRWK